MLFIRLILQRAATDDMACRINIKCFYPNIFDRVCAVPGQLSEVITLSVSLSRTDSNSSPSEMPSLDEFSCHS